MDDRELSQPRCKDCYYQLPHGPAGCIVRAGLRTPLETREGMVDSLTSALLASEQRNVKLQEEKRCLQKELNFWMDHNIP